MSDLRRLFFLVLLLIPGAVALAQPVIELKPEDGLRNIVLQCEFFEDTSAAMTIMQVSSGDIPGRFRPFEKTIGNFDITSSAIWIRFKCTSAVTDKWYLKASPEMVTDFRFFSFENGSWKSSARGYINPKDHNGLNMAMLAFPLNIARGDTAQFYVRIKSTYPLFVLLNTGNANALLKADHTASTIGGIYIGILIIMILYNLFLFISNRSRGYIFYALYVFFCGVFILFTNGYATHFPRFIQLIQAEVSALIPIAFGLFGLLFTADFLDLKKIRPGWHRLLIFFYISCIVVVPSSYFWPLLGSHMIQYLGLLLGIYCIVAGVLAWRSGYSPARFYLLGFGIYMLSLIVYIALGIAGTAITGFDINVVLLTGSALEAIILSFAIGDKLNTALRGQQQAQAETLASLQENEKLIREQNIVLERKVKERTSEISEQKAIIEEKNKDILSSINYARRIQHALLASDQLLTENLPEYFILYKPKDIVS
ncbi:MAG: protein serine/threonine phosphatase, partial [Bacteroidetes bacterium]